MTKLPFRIAIMLLFVPLLSFSRGVALSNYERDAVINLVNNYYLTLNQMAQTNKDDVAMGVLTENLYRMFNDAAGARLYDDYNSSPVWVSTIDKFLPSIMGSRIISNIKSIRCDDSEGDEYVKLEKPRYFEGEPQEFQVTLLVEKEMHSKFGVTTRFQKIAVALPKLRVVGVLDDSPNPYQNALRYYSDKDYEKALSCFEQYIKTTNDVDSKFRAAIMYLKKQGCKKMKRSERDERAVQYLKDVYRDGLLEDPTKQPTSISVSTQQGQSFIQMSRETDDFGSFELGIGFRAYTILNKLGVVAN